MNPTGYHKQHTGPDSFYRTPHYGVRDCPADMPNRNGACQVWVNYLGDFVWININTHDIL